MREEKPPRSDKWRTQLAEARSKLGLPSRLRLWVDDMEANGMPKTERVKEIIEFVAASKLKEKGFNILKPLAFSTKKKKS